MDDQVNRNFGGSTNQLTADASSKTQGAMHTDGDDLNSELRQIEREIDRCKPTLESCRVRCENIETEICDVRRLQRKAQFVLDNVRSEEENLHERLKNIRLNYEACVEKSGGHEDPNETIRTKIGELTTQRKVLSEELARLKGKADDNRKKLDRVRAMIAEQEEKNATQVRELKEISESAVSISPHIKKRIDAILGYQEIN